MSELFEKLTTNETISYVVTCLPTVKEKKKRYRTPANLRDFLKDNKFLKARVKESDGNLYVIYTKLNKEGFIVQSSEWLPISKYESKFVNQLELYNNSLTFKIAEKTDEYIILSLPLRVLRNGMGRELAKVRVGNITEKQITDNDIFEMKHLHHVKGIPMTKLAVAYGISVGKVKNFVGTEL